MSQLSQSPTRARGPVLVFALLALAACSDRSRDTGADSLLSRDLTLAAPSQPPVVGPFLGDTGAVTPPASVVAAPAARAATPGRLEVRKPAPAPRPRVVAPRAPSPVSAPPVAVSAPTPNPVVPAPIGGGTGAVAGGTGAVGGGTAAVGASKRIGTGASLVGRTDAKICSLANRPGDRFVATLAADVTGEDGALIPAGSPILVEMAPAAEGSDFAFRAKAVQVGGTLIPMEGSVRVEGETTGRRVSKGGDKGKVVTGAVIGAILGRVLGGGTKGTVIGAAGGAAAGTVAAARNSVAEHCLPAGATLTVTLSAPLILSQGVP